MSSKKYFDVNDNNNNRFKKLTQWLSLFFIFIFIFSCILLPTLVLTWPNFFLVITGWFFSNLIPLIKFFIFRSIKIKTLKEIRKLEDITAKSSRLIKINGPYKFIKSELRKVKNKKLLVSLSTCKTIINLIITPDYEISKWFKNSIKNSTDLASKSHFKLKKYMIFIEKEARKGLVIKSNRFNLLISLFLVTITIFATTLFQDLFQLKWLNILLCSFIIFRVLHRSFEVIPAFYYDVVNKNINGKGKYFKNSNLKKGHRIALGFKTIIEISLLNGLLYYFMYNLELITLDESKGRLIDFILYSTSVSQVANVSFDIEFTLLHQIVHVLQNTVTLIIIAFSISYYLGNDDQYTPEELENLKRLNIAYKKKRSLF